MNTTTETKKKWNFNCIFKNKKKNRLNYQWLHDYSLHDFFKTRAKKVHFIWFDGLIYFEHFGPFVYAVSNKICSIQFKHSENTLLLSIIYCIFKVDEWLGIRYQFIKHLHVTCIFLYTRVVLLFKAIFNVIKSKHF